MTDSTTKPEADEAEGVSEFEAAFAEIAEAKNPAANAAGGDDESDGSAKNEQSAPSGRDDADDIPADGSGAPDPSAQQATDKEPADPVAALEAARAEVERLKHRLSSDDGRVAALNRELQQLRQQAVGQGEGKADPPKGAKDLLEGDDLKAWREEYPEVAEPVLRLIQAQQETIDRLSGTMGKIDEDKAETFYEKQFTVYAEQHPDWADYVGPQSRHGTKFAGWLEAQPRYVREAVERNSDNIVDANEAADVLSKFKREAGISGGQASPKPDVRRQKQLDAAADVRTKTPPVAAGVPDDFEAAFESYARKAEARARR